MKLINYCFVIVPVVFAVFHGKGTTVGSLDLTSGKITTLDLPGLIALSAEKACLTAADNIAALGHYHIVYFWNVFSGKKLSEVKPPYYVEKIRLIGRKVVMANRHKVVIYEKNKNKKTQGEWCIVTEPVKKRIKAE